MERHRILSSDDHTHEPWDLWLNRMDPKYGDNIPHLVQNDDGDFWWVGDLRVVGLSSGTHPGRRYEPDPQVRDEISATRIRREHLRPGGYDPIERLKDMEIDGIDKSIVYSTVAMHLYKVEDAQYLTELYRAYNDWIAEYCSAVPDRLFGIAFISVEDTEAAVAELYRCKKMGLVGAMIPEGPSPGMRYNLPVYDPFWAASEELGMPLSFHIGCNRPAPENEFMDTKSLSSSFLANVDHFPRMSLGDMIFSFVFERFPKLRVGVIEHETAWVPHFLERINYTYTQRTGSARRNRQKFKNDMLPSDFWYRNCFVGFQEDELTIRLKDIIGVDNLQFGADYPHDEGTFPKSQEIVARLLADCTEEEKDKILWGNAARVYNLE